MDLEVKVGPPKEINKLNNIDVQSMSILRTILERCKEEKSSNCLQVPLDDVYERVSLYTALPKTLIYHIDGNHITDCDIHDRIAIMKCINIYLAKQEEITITNLYETFNIYKKTKTPNYKFDGGIKTFERNVFGLGYVFKKSLKGPPLVLVENPKLKFERFHYLNKMKNYRKLNRQIYYADVRHISPLPFSHATKDYPKTTIKPTDILTFFYVMSCEGYELGIFVNQGTDKNLEHTFKKWMIDVVIHSLKQCSVVVMENNAITGLQPKRPITHYHSKTQMIKWLKSNNIPCTADMEKPRLYELIEKCTKNDENYDIDRIFKQHSHDVLRIPTNLSSVNPVHHLWDSVNNHLISSKQTDVTFFLLNHLKNISNQFWTSILEQMKGLEIDIYKTDLDNEDLLENYELDEQSFYEESISNFSM